MLILVLSILFFASVTCNIFQYMWIRNEEATAVAESQSRKDRHADIVYALEACVMAWVANPKATVGWCCHHEHAWEPVDGLSGALERILFMLHTKNEWELVRRFNNFRPASADLATAYSWLPAQEKKEHYKDVPNNTWNGHSIFSVYRR